MPPSEKLEEVLKLVQETGDRCIVIPEKGEPYVILSIEAYRNILNVTRHEDTISALSESELLDRINGQIAEWRESRREEFAEYSLSQFSLLKQKSGLESPQANSESKITVEPPAKPQAKFSGPAFRPVSHFPQGGETLPVIDEHENTDEYKLEPKE